MNPPSWLRLSSWGVLAFLYVPVLVLTVFSFNAARLSASWRGVTLRWYGDMVRDEALWQAVHNSLIVAICSTALAVGLGLAAAVALESGACRGAGCRRLVDAVFVLPLLIPEVMMGVSLLLLFVLLRLPLSVATVTIGHAVFNLPVVTWIVRARLRKLDPRLVEAARDLGATPWLAFRRVTLPLLMPAVVGAALLAFTVSLDDFVVTFFTAGPGATTLPLYVYAMVKSGVTPVINALSASLVAVSMFLVAGALLLQRR